MAKKRVKIDFPSMTPFLILRLFFFFAVFCCGGCVTLESSSPAASNKEIMRAYLKDVIKDDGIDEREAILLAQSQMIFQGYDTGYYMNRLEIIRDDDTMWGIRFPPIPKTYAEIHTKPTIVVLISKKDGQVNLFKEISQAR